jgi:hypothetical protein
MAKPKNQMNEDCPWRCSCQVAKVQATHFVLPAPDFSTFAASVLRKFSAEQRQYNTIDGEDMDQDLEQVREVLKRAPQRWLAEGPIMGLYSHAPV